MLFCLLYGSMYDHHGSSYNWGIYQIYIKKYNFLRHFTVRVAQINPKREKSIVCINRIASL